MHPVRSLLIVLDPLHANSLALKRGRMIAKASGAHLHLLMVDPHQDHSALLTLLKSQLHDEGLSATAEQNWNDSVHQTVLDVQQAEGSALIVKQHFPDNALKRALLTPSDWKLLRGSHCPVLLVKHDRPWGSGRILAAVDVGNHDEAHRALHGAIIEKSRLIAQWINGEMHVISAYPAPMLAASDPVFQQKESLEAHYREQCRLFQARHGIDDDHLHLTEGPADVLIPHTAHVLAAVVTVLGSVARTGLSGALIGNTSEVVLDQLETDILVLKPEAQPLAIRDEEPLAPSGS